MVLTMVTSLPIEYEMLVQAIGRSARNNDFGSVTWVDDVMSYTTHRIQSPPIEKEIKNKLLEPFYEGYYSKTKMNPSLGAHPGATTMLIPIINESVQLGDR